MDPPIAVLTLIALRNAARVSTLLGRKSSSTSPTAHLPCEQKREWRRRHTKGYRVNPYLPFSVGLTRWVNPIHIHIHIYRHIYMNIYSTLLGRKSSHTSPTARLPCEFRLPKPLSDQFPVRVCSCPLCIINRL